MPRRLFVPTAAAIGVALYVLALDAWIYRDALTPEYLAVMQRPLAQRLIGFSLRAFGEECAFRLIVLSALLLLLKRLNALTPITGIAAAVVAQCLNVWLGLPRQELTGQLLLYDALRFVLPGVLWGLIFWRYGFWRDAGAHVGCRLILQPALGALL